MAAAGIAAVALVAITATWGSSNQAGATRHIARISDGMSRQWNADMMHDGLRADVMAALYATSDAQRERFGVAEVTEHAQVMLENFDAAAAEAPAGLQAEYTRVRPAVVAYGKTAKAVVAADRTTGRGPAAGLPGSVRGAGDRPGRDRRRDARRGGKGR